jgi:ADP-ribose pyrophosphatase YjhB (NUDIX family)
MTTREDQILYFAQKAFIVHEDMLLVLRKSEDDPHNPGLWEVPGGRMHFGEEVDDHIRREVREETGLEIEPGRPFFIWSWQLRGNIPNTDAPRAQIVAVARLCTPVDTVTTTAGQVEGDFISEARWVRIGELRDLRWIGNMTGVVDRFLDERLARRV